MLKTRKLLKTFAVAICSLIVWLPVQAQDKPDFTGTWTTYRGTGGPGGFTAPGGGSPQLTEEAQLAVADYRAVTEGTDYSPGNACVGSGMPGSMLGSGGYPMEILQLPDQFFVIYEAHSEIRRFYLGNEIQNSANFFPERNGYSTARWEGDRLIVETTQLKTQVDSRYPHSNQTTTTEVYYLDEAQADGSRVLVAELTMNDPLWLDEPFQTTKRWQEMDGYHVLTYECAEPLWLDDMEELYEEAGLKMIQE